MNADLKAKWLEALRSGRYQQARGALRRDTSTKGSEEVGYCCLGVLCDIVGPEEWDHTGTGVAIWRHAAGSLPANLRVEIDLDYRVEKDLIDANDSGKDFGLIADIIEQRA